LGLVWSGDRVLEAAELERRARQAASGFASLGVGPGDGVATYLRNDYPFFEASLGAGISAPTRSR
jgi:long-chain acyl-CoA synthetase